jgi:hypothetical protein
MTKTMSKSVSFRSKPLTEIHVDDDPSRVIRLDLSYSGVFTRLRAAQPRLDAIGAKFAELKNADTRTADVYADAILEVEPQLKEIIDEVFNANVCEPACGGASLFALDDGMYLFERIIDVLGGLYAEQMAEEQEAHKKRIEKHIAKYRG